MVSTRGSLWSRWDLHVHTPESFYQRYEGSKEEQWTRFLDDLENLAPEFKVIGINDYIFIDGYRRILEERKRNRLSNLDLVLPVIELRLDKFVGTEGHFKKINLHVIFSDEISPDTIEAQFLNGLSNEYRLSREAADTGWNALPTRDSITELGQMILDTTPKEKRPGISPLHHGFNNIAFSLDRIREILSGHNFRNKHLVAIGKAEWESMRWSDHGIAEKKDVIQSADMVFTAAESPEACRRALGKLREQEVNDRLFDCSDAHSYSDSADKDRIGHCYTWVKADPTFLGLQHALKEYRARVYLGTEPPKLSVIRAEGGRFIRSIEIRKVPGAKCEEDWFDCELQLNHDLVAIIGRKGSGKSALTDVIGLLGNNDREEFFHFSIRNDSDCLRRTRRDHLRPP